ncbi:MAG: archease [Deltaproteobacteria bacterium]|nr:archease [Deltaproteobacteria bacterium]
MEGFRYLDHTGDLGIELFGRSREALFEHAGEAFTDIVTDPATVHASFEVEISVDGADVEQLLVEWLTELIYRFDAQGWLFRRYRIRSLDDHHLSGTVQGEPYDPDRHPIRTTVKGATYHQLEVTRTEDGWKARVIFDL